MTLAARYINPLVHWKEGTPIKYEYCFIIYRKETQEILFRQDRKYKWDYLDSQLEQDAQTALSEFQLTDEEGNIIEEEKDMVVLMDWMEGGPVE